MSNPPIRKVIRPNQPVPAVREQNWQPWEMHDFAAPHQPTSTTQTTPSIKAPPVPSLSEAELERLRQEAQQQGLQLGRQQGEKQGYDTGFQKGLDEGRIQGLQQALAEQQPLLESWQQLLQEFQQSLKLLDNVITARLMQVALTAAKQIIGQTPICDANTIILQIQHLVQQEPIFTGHLQLRVNPQDLPLVQQKLGVQLQQQGWTLLADTQLHRGGCKISAEGGELDASIATRWQELCKLAAPEFSL